MLQVAVGHSNDPDSHYAVAEVLEQCHSTLAENQPQAGILFAGIDFEHSLILQEIQKAFPGIALIGGTTDGELSSIMEYQQDSLTLMLFCVEGIEIAVGIGKGVSHDATAATEAAVKQASSNMKNEPLLCLTIYESLTASGVAILEGLKTALGKYMPIVGGTSGDGLQLKQSYQFCNTEVTSDAVSVLLFSGNLHFSHGIAHGWNPIGKPGIVTKVDNNILYEIDGIPAIDFYRYYLGELPPSPEYPLAVFEANNQDFYLRGTPGTNDSNSGSITFVADIPLGSCVQIAEATRNNVLAAAETSILQALAAFPGGKEPCAALFFSCTARRQILGTQTKVEYLRLKNRLPPSLTCCGFYCYGEIAPLQANGKTRFHNETFVTLLLGSNR
jgi:hypothetical protein